MRRPSGARLTGSRALLMSLLVSAGATRGRPARAQTPSEIATARQWFADGLAREEKGEFSAALDLFRRAMQVKKTPQIAYHVGFCESRTGALVEALVDLDGAASAARATHAEDVVTAAQSELAEVKKRIPTLEVKDEGGAKATRFIVDGSAIALSMLRTPMPLDPGEHSVSLEYPSGASTAKRVTLAEHEQRTLEISPQPEAAATPVTPPAATPAPAPAQPQSPAAPEPAGRGPTVLPWTLVGVGGALVAGGAALFAAARSKESALHEACPSRMDCDPSLSGTYDTATTLNALGLGLGAAGIAAAGVGAWILAVRPSASATTALVISPRGALVRGEF